MDFFAETPMKELQHRAAGRTLEQWKQAQPLYKSFQAQAGEVCNFKQRTIEYLNGDVECLLQLVEKMGTHMWAAYKADIRQKMTIGSLAEHIWQHTLLKDIPKLRTKAEHDKWQRVNRGGFCGPLSRFDYTAEEGEQAYKTDKTSLYPASSKEIEFETEDGVQKPLEHWYKGFPSPTIGKTTGLGGWRECDYEGRQMGQEEYDELSEMHGIIKIRFDQSQLAFPFLPFTCGV